MELFDMFPDEQAAERWFVETRWPSGVTCAHCGSDNVSERANRRPQPYHCKACRQYFSVKTNTLMQGSNLKLRVWAVAMYLLTTGLKGESSMKLHRDIKVTQKTAWHLAHRIRETWSDQAPPTFEGPVEVDEAYFGGKERNKHASRRSHPGGGHKGKAVVAGARDRETNQISATVLPNTTHGVLQQFALDRTTEEAQIFTDEFRAYRRLPNHTAVRHNVGEYVNEQAHTNGMESFWATMKRGYYGTYHRMSPAHLQRYVNEFAGRHNQRTCDTIVQMRIMVAHMVGKRLRFKDLAVGRNNPSARPIVPSGCLKPSRVRHCWAWPYRRGPPLTRLRWSATANRRSGT